MQTELSQNFQRYVKCRLVHDLDLFHRVDFLRQYPLQHERLLTYIDTKTFSQIYIFIETCIYIQMDTSSDVMVGELD